MKIEYHKNRNNEVTTVKESQSDIANAYANGSMGIVVSGLVWLISDLERRKCFYETFVQVSTVGILFNF